MTCPLTETDGTTVLLELAAGRFVPDLPELEAHVLQCSLCAEMKANLEMVWRALDLWTLPAVRPGFDVFTTDSRRPTEELRPSAAPVPTAIHSTQWIANY